MITAVQLRTNLLIPQAPLLPLDPFDSRYEIEMTLTGDDGQRMLSTKRCDPDVVGRNGRSRFFEFGTDDRIRNGGSILDVENTKFAQMLR